MTGVAAADGAAADSLDALQAEVDGMAGELDKGLSDQQKQELEQLRVEVEAQRDGVETSGTLGALKDRLDGIERQLDIADDVRKLSSKLEGEDSLGGGAAADGAAGQDADSAALRNRLGGLQDRYDNLKRDVETDDVSVDELDTLTSDARTLQNDVATDVLNSENAMADDAEDTAQELTDDAIRESDKMVDQLERAQVAETKRAVFRSLTRLRGAAINSFDGIARAQTGNIDEYAHTHKWRDAHPVHHLAAEEADVSKWAFPANADFAELHSYLSKRPAEPDTGRQSVRTLLAQW